MRILRNTIQLIIVTFTVGGWVGWWVVFVIVGSWHLCASAVRQVREWPGFGRKLAPHFQLNGDFQRK